MTMPMTQQHIRTKAAAGHVHEGQRLWRQPPSMHKLMAAAATGSVGQRERLCELVLVPALQICMLIRSSSRWTRVLLTSSGGSQRGIATRKQRGEPGDAPRQRSLPLAVESSEAS